MKVFKFGGASVKDANAVRNTSRILQRYTAHERLVIVVSAMGKTTNALEKLLDEFLTHKNYLNTLDEIKSYHLNIVRDLFGDNQEVILRRLETTFLQLETAVKQAESNRYDESYDQVVCFGEIISTHIVAEFLQTDGIRCQWLDARDYIKTDTRWREGKVDWVWTEKLISTELLVFMKYKSIVTQGFIGGTVGNQTTTLGREGSDFSAAIFASCLNAESLTIWKDVSGILNADPKLIANTHLYPQLSYTEAAEMTYYGATVIHSKTIKPLANRRIPLYVRSFIDSETLGTCISEVKPEHIVPAIIFKPYQTLISFGVKDFTFITEKNLSTILHELARLNIKINLMQSSAISFSICTDQNSVKLASLKDALQNDFSIHFNENLKLITVKNYDEATIEQVTEQQQVLLEQKTRSTYQIVVRTQKV